MELTRLLCGIFQFTTILARSIAPYGAQQQPLKIEDPSSSDKSYITTIVLGFTEEGNSAEGHLRIQLGERLSRGRNSPAHPMSVWIMSVLNQHGQSVPLDRFDEIICRTQPEVSVEEKALVESGMKPKVWPWFGVRDGTVYPNSEDSRWFLGGRAIEYYECR